MNNYDEKIQCIKETQKELLKLVKNKIIEENEIFNLDTRNIVDVLNHDNKVIKKYEAIIKAKELIEEYTNQIQQATDIEEIKEIRKKLNSCINKIKKEMKNRGFDDIEINNYTEEAKKLRKKIAFNIRVLKREEKIKEIEVLNNNIDNLSNEELIKFKKLIKNEVSYGKRNLNYDENKIVKKVIFEEKEKKNVINFNIPRDDKVKTNKIKSYDNLEDFLKEKIVEYEGYYYIQPIDKYNGNFIKNIRIFTKNIPNILKNKDSVERMKCDNRLYIRKAELRAYYRYIEENSSIIKNFKQAIKPSVLDDKESEYVDEHQRIVKWIIEYCNTHHMNISYNQRMY